MKLKMMLSAALVMLSQSVIAAEHEVKMLNAGADGIMVFEPGYLKIEKGDTVKFVAADTGHNAVNEIGPAGTQELSGYEGGTYTFNDEGVNIYYCLPHKSMAMYGVIQVGNAVNKDEAMEKGKAIDSAMAMNNGRLVKYLEQVK